MAVELLASAATLLLKEAWPHLKDAAGDAGGAALKKIAGEKGMEWAEAAGLLKKKVDEDPVAGALAGVLVKEPESEDALRSLRDHLERRLERDEAWRAELVERMEGVDIDVGDHSWAVSGGVHGEQISIGDGGVQIRVMNGDVYLVQGQAGTGDSEARVGDRHRDHYLRWVMEETRDLALGGVDPSAARGQDRYLQLAGVYTALRTTTPRQDRLMADPGGRRGERAAHEPPIPALEQLDEHDRLVLLGQPGGGKSTFVDFVAHCLAGEALGLVGAGIDLLTAPLPQDDGSEGEERQPWSHGALLPVRVVLRDVAAKIAKSAEEICAEDLLGFILDGLDDAALGPCRGPVEEVLRAGEALVLLDGLDEVPEAQARRRAICTLVESFVAAFSKCRFVVTSRTYAYQDQGFRLKKFEAVELAPFGEGQIRRFVHRWYEQVAEQKKLTEENAKGRAVLLERAVFGSKSLRELAERPLLLTLMASLHAWRGGSLPRDRHRLYEDTVELLLDVWEGQRREQDRDGNYLLEEPSLTEWLRIERGDVLDILGELAYEAHGAQPETVGTADIPAERLVSRLMKLKGRDAEDVHPKRLADYLSQRAGILEERGDGVYTFPHRTFQEYLAAYHLTESGFDLDEIAALGRKDPNRWREVVLLAAASLANFSSWDLAAALAFDGRDSDATESAWGLHLAGHALVETANLKQVSERNQERLDAIRRRLADLLAAPQLPAKERALAGVHLATLGDPRFDAEAPHLPVDETAGFLRVPGGRYVMGSRPEEIERAIGEVPRDWDDSIRDVWVKMIRSEAPRHEVELTPFFLARHPVTTAQFRAYVDATGVEIGDREALRGVANQPVVWVDWHEAMAYCEWLGSELRELATARLQHASSEEASRLWSELAEGRLVARLPSEAQWEAAARGEDARPFPWGGEEPTAELANFEGLLGGPSSAGVFDAGRGPFGHQDLAGNVWEWCLDEWSEEAYPERGEKAVDPQRFAGMDRAGRVFRGGSWANPAGDLRAAYRLGFGSWSRRDLLGFRVVLCRPPEP